MTLAALLLLASFLSGLSLEVATLHVRPEQALAPLVGLLALFRPVRGRVPLVAGLALVFVAAGLFGAFGEPEAGRAGLHGVRLLATLLPVALLPLLLDARDAERAWDLFLGLALAEAVVALAAAAAHAWLGTSWGVTVEGKLGYAHPQGTLLEPNILGALGAAAAVAFLLRAADGRLGRGRRLVAAAALLVLTAAVGVSMTRAAWFALPLAGAALLVAGVEHRERRRAFAAAIALALLGVASVGTLLAFADRDALFSARTGLAGKISSLARLSEDPNVAVRLRSYRAALDLAQQRPFLGAGHGAMERLPGSEDRTMAWAGNLEVHLLADTGVTGLLALTLLCALAFLGSARRARRDAEPEGRRRALERAGALAVVLLCAQATETSWLASFWVLLGLCLAADAREEEGGARKVLFVHPSDELYGSDRVLLDLVRGLPRERVEPLVLLSTDVPYAGMLSARLADLGVHVKRFRLGVLRKRTLATPLAAARLAVDAVVATARIATLIVRERVDVVHANTITVVPAAVAARLTGRPVVWHVHEIVPPRPMRGAFLLAVDMLATRVVAVSGAVKDGLGPAGRRADVVENGVALPPPSAPPEEPPLVLFAGRLSERKGPDVLLLAAGLLAKKHPRVGFLLLGDEFAGGTAFRERLERLVEEQGLGERVTFHPFVEEIAPFLARAAVAVNPSRVPEPFGLFIVEAMAAGRPVVASATGGPAETIEDGVSGLLVPPGDPAALAAALDALLSDPARAAEMGAAARRRAAARFPVERCAARFLAVYEEVGSPRAASRAAEPAYL